MLRRPFLPGTAPGLLFLVLAACAAPQPPEPPPAPAHLTPEVLAHYGSRPDGEVELPAVPARYLSPENLRQEVNFITDERPGTVIVDPWTRHLYYVLPENRAVRYRVAVGDEGRAFSGQATIPYSRSWPSWRPTENMIREFPDQYGPLRGGMDGGLMNPLGARALYLHRGGKDTFYRIHGTSDVTSIGNATSAGCIRMFHQDVIELETLVKSGAKVVVLTEEQSDDLSARQGSSPKLGS
ncbi:L,D-transpeptidase [Falsigemmobacter faecalis]|uniref:L,D-transpeptidase n=1 Tax=Falsigemmobacter faecalis TaxID=2488730 RepID=A0A3P3DHQ3_9RHOB|nr:L,D-transpeptidase [Falsigemmobacter faecalis]RRH73799.1 L,D-transpeptidase [Falsigemmobacter faecalis]